MHALKYNEIHQLTRFFNPSALVVTVQKMVHTPDSHRQKGKTILIKSEPNTHVQVRQQQKLINF